MSRISSTFERKKNILNIYLTAGYPNLDDTVLIVQELEKSGADMIEIGIPFSDPLADGVTIQKSSQIAISNGITLDKIFDQIKVIRETVQLPIILMGYYNQLLQYGVSSFFEKASSTGVDGFIIPDLPLNEYQKKYKGLLNELNLDMIFLITPQTGVDRIKMIDRESSGFIYVVSSYAVTGSKREIEQHQLDYFKRIQALSLHHPTLIGFGIGNKESFQTACQHANGGIIGSAFLHALTACSDVKEATHEFVKSIL